MRRDLDGGHGVGMGELWIVGTGRAWGGVLKERSGWWAQAWGGALKQRSGWRA